MLKRQIATLTMLMAFGLSEGFSYDEHDDKMIEFAPDDGKSQTRLHIVRDSDVKSWQREQWDAEKKFYQKWAKRAHKIVSKIWHPPSKDHPTGSLMATFKIPPPPVAPTGLGLVATGGHPLAKGMAQATQAPYVPRYAPKRPWSKNLMARIRLKGQLMAARKMGKPGQLASNLQGDARRQTGLQLSALQARSVKARHDVIKVLPATTNRGPASASSPQAPWQKWWSKVKSLAPAWLKGK